MKTFLIYLIVGILLVILGIRSMKKDKEKAGRCCAPAMGRIVRVEEELDQTDEGNHRKKNYTPFFQYIVNGQSVVGSSNFYSTNKNEYKVGDTADILFNPSKPSEFVIKGKSEKSGKLFALVLILVGLGMIVLGITQL